jgi:dolichol-phosphate mannosyltransferase
VIYIVLPSYNEEKALRKLLPLIQETASAANFPFRVIVVDDGSRDGTSEVARSFADALNIRVLRFEQNRGVAEVLKAGLRLVLEESRDPDEDVCVILDADNTHDPRLILEIIPKLREGEDIVVASRFRGNGGMVGCPLPRRLLSYAVSWTMRIAIHIPHITDYSTFYRAYRVSVLRKGFDAYGDDLLAGKGFAPVGGMLIKLSNLTRRISEVPLLLRYDLKAGRSGNRLFKTARGYVELILASWATNRFRTLMRRTPGS